MAQIAPVRARPAPLNALVSQQLGVYNQGHPNRPIDPRAALAVAAQEGLGGGIGDGGHAFGPFQLNNAGGVLTGRFPGQSPQQLQSWATSPAGIQDALAGIGGVAGGLKGDSAVRAIVSRFERPANIPGEIARALASYGIQPDAVAPALAQAAAGHTGSTRSSAAAPPMPDFRAALAQHLASAAASPTNDLSSFYSTLHQALQARQQQTSPPPAASSGGAPHGTGLAGDAQASTIPAGHGRITGDTSGEQQSFLQSLAALAAFEHAPISINSGYRSTAKQAQLYANRASNPNPVAPPGHSLHEQGLAADGTVGGVPLGQLPAAVLRRFGLASVPGDPVHVQIRR